MAARVCICCGNIVCGNRAREHVVPQWLLEELELREEELYQAVAGAADRAIQDERRHTTGRFVEGRVCATCNSGWMSRLENDARPVLTSLILGHRTPYALDNAERLTIARWATKTANVLSHAAPLGNPTESDHLRALSCGRDAMPEGVGVFANQHQSTREFSYFQKNHWPQFSQGGQAENPGTEYKLALQFRALLLLVAFWPEPADRLVLASGIHVPLWPSDQRFFPSYYAGIEVPMPYDSPSLLERFSDSLAVLRQAP